MSITHEVWERLGAAFGADEIEWRETGGRDAPYPRPDAIMDRLDNVVGPENWHYILTVVSADPRPVYVCDLFVRIPGTTEWVRRSATSGEPNMGGKRGPDFLNSGKAGGTYAFRKSFQDGFCRYLSNPANWPPRHAGKGNWTEDESHPDEVPISWSGAERVSEWDSSPEEQRRRLEEMRGPKPTDFGPLRAKGVDFDPDAPPCPTCGGRTWDNREPERGGKGQFPKRKPNQPDFKCRDKACQGALWPAK